MNKLDVYKKDYKRLIDLADDLFLSINYECNKDEYDKLYKEKYPEKYTEIISKIKKFSEHYQVWYSESLVLIKQLLPDRLNDFKSYYEMPKNRKELSHVTYCIEDYLQNTVRKSGFNEIIVNRSSAIPKFEQQKYILKSLDNRFESSLFEIKTLVQADFFDSEIDAAKELSKHKFFRSAGALIGVVLERHLKEVVNNHNLKLPKKAPCISDYNDFLKNNDIIDTVTWRFIQHLGDIRNLCDHDKTQEPTAENINDLVNGIDKIIKTVF